MLFGMVHDMRLTYPQPPPKILQLAYGAMNMEMLRHPHTEHSPSPTSNASASGHVPDLHKVFLLTPAQIAKRQFLRWAMHTSWYDVVVLSGVGHGIEVALNAKGPSRYVTRGSAIDQQLSILTALIGEPAKGVFEVRVLRIPQLVPFSFWLKAADDRASRLVPVVSHAPQLQAGTKYKAKEFFDALRKAASHLVAVDLTPSPRGGERAVPKAPKKALSRKAAAVAKPAHKR
jgi:hypothetical protein